jgi:gluconokinase
MGVAGCGKSTVAKALANHLSVICLEGDDFHAAQSIEKMSRGEPLTDNDRWPWLQRIGEQLSALQSPAVVSCSALRRVYREHMISHYNGKLEFIHLAAEQTVIAKRMADRKGHFMPTDLLASQYETLEPLQPDEPGVVIDISGPVEHVIASAINYVESLTV